MCDADELRITEGDERLFLVSKESTDTGMACVEGESEIANGVEFEREVSEDELILFEAGDTTSNVGTELMPAYVLVGKPSSGIIFRWEADSDQEPEST